MDLYEILGLHRSATTAEIRRAYQKLARRLHPDLNPGDPAAADRFRSVSRAFEVLSNPELRVRYDRGEPQPSGRSSTPDVGFEGFDFSAELRVGDVGFREIFDGVLGTRPARPEPEPSRGEDLEQTTRLAFHEALEGTRRRIHLVRMDHCPACQGSGDVPQRPVRCPRCGGTGSLRAARGHMIFSRACPECRGTGTLDRRACPRCDGEGRLMRSEWLDIEIPPGVREGSRIRLAGCGNVGPRGGPAGDFVLVVEAEPHAFFRREGDDLHCTVPVTVSEAAHGAHVDVPTPNGPVTVEIPAGTQPGHRLRLRKRGVPKLGEKGRGDLYVEIQIWVPTITDESGRALLAELDRLDPHDPRKDLAARARVGKE
jgi:molecular chaperone DnaJ